MEEMEANDVCGDAALLLLLLLLDDADACSSTNAALTTCVSHWHSPSYTSAIIAFNTLCARANALAPCVPWLTCACKSFASSVDLTSLTVQPSSSHAWYKGSCSLHPMPCVPCDTSSTLVR